MHHRGACRCGAVAFEIDGVHADDRQDGSTHPAGAPAPAASPEDAGAARLPPAHAGFGSVLWAVPRARIRMRPPEPAIGAFTYSGWLVGHRFCTTCGMHLFGEEIVEEAAGALPMAYVNRECLEASAERADDLSDDSSDCPSFGADDAIPGDGDGTGPRRLEPAE